ncbi:helix-turn-helix transcriptional regulator [Bacillus sp. 2205SS5-2]|uniref:helix-turn-helix transcriptional regulator n=1 Tax=Bacillus sp. 2205SS5-2 TaxID=3109031 RepID=UPI003006CC65
MKNRVKEYRARYNYSQEKLASLIKVSRQTIGFIEKNKMLPSTLLALKLAKVFDCSVEDLFFLEEGHDGL